MENYDAVIAGAGPAGLKCAETLLKAGKSVLVLEKNRQVYKVCTGIYGLTHKRMEWDIPESCFERKFRKLVVYYNKKKVVFSRKRPFAASLDRKKLSDYQIRQVRKLGGEIRFSSPVTRVGPGYVEAGGKKYHYRSLVGADGCNSIVRKHLKLKTRAGIAMQYWIKDPGTGGMELTYDTKRFGPWFAWVVPHRDRVCVGVGGDPENIPAGELKKRLDAWLDERGIKSGGSRFEAAPISWNYRGFRFGDIFLAGEAAGFTSPMTGGGICFALASGYDVARKITNPNYKCRNIGKVLGIKRRHMVILRLVAVFGPVAMRMLPVLLRNGYFQRKWIELSC